MLDQTLLDAFKLVIDEELTTGLTVKLDDLIGKLPEDLKAPAQLYAPIFARMTQDEIWTVMQGLGSKDNLAVQDMIRKNMNGMELAEEKVKLAAMTRLMAEQKAAVRDFMAQLFAGILRIGLSAAMA